MRPEAVSITLPDKSGVAGGVIVTILTLLNYAGVLVFAATGALAASRRQLDIVGFIFLANVTGIGGGTIRDLILGDDPVFWVKEPLYLVTGTSAAILVYFTAHLVESRYRVLLWLDALGLAFYSAMGAAKGLDMGASALVAIVTGIFTATLGGVLRDIIAGEPSVLLKREVYVTSALAGACVYVAMYMVQIDTIIAVICGSLAAFIVRGGALIWGWKLPIYKPHPGRTEDELKRDGFIRKD